MIYLQLVLLLLVVLIHVYRPAVVSRWDRLKKAKIFLAISIAVEPVFMVLAMPVDGRAAAFPGTLARGSALECGFTALALAFLVFSLKTGTDANGEGK